MSDNARNSVESPVSATENENAADGKTAVDNYDVEAAEILANEAQHLPLSESTSVYEKLLLAFPTAGKFWKLYVEAHMSVNNHDATKQIFSRCLLTCLYIPLWRCYTRFIKKVNENKGMDGYEETRKAFDFMLSYVGADISAGPVWIEYINFLKSLPAHTTQEETQRMTSVRKAYQKAILTPTHHIDQLWKEYESFENSVSRALAKGLLSEYQPKYISAKAFYRERKKYIDDIDWNTLAVPPTGSFKEEVQWMSWKRYLTFEKGNPQRIDSTLSNKRIAFTYEQCLMYMYHYPDIWFDYAMWHAKSGSSDAAVKVFQRAVKAHPASEILRYAYAELEESLGDIQAAKGIYESFIGNGVNVTSLAHIQFIRFLRRNEGVEASRKYFLDARKSSSCTYHVYIAYALMAFYLDKDPKVAHNVFEAGVKQFMNEPAYVLEYADFLSLINDDRNARALFERALSSLTPDLSFEVWKRFVHFEKTYGDLQSMIKVERRRREALSSTGEEEVIDKDGSLQDIASRYSFMGLWPCSAKDLDLLVCQEWLERNVKKRGDRPALPNGAAFFGFPGNPPIGQQNTPPAELVYPDTSRMLIYDPRQNPGPVAGGLDFATVGSGLLSDPPSIAVADGGACSANDVWKATPPVLVAFIANLPSVEGPVPDADLVLSLCLKSDVPVGSLSTAPAGRVGDHNKGGGIGQAQQKPQTDAFRMRHLHKARAVPLTTTAATTASLSASLSHGSLRSSDISGSTA